VLLLLAVLLVLALPALLALFALGLLALEVLLLLSLLPVVVLLRLARVLPWPVLVERHDGRRWRVVEVEPVRGLRAARARVAAHRATLG
jgi:hypothetical protein